MTRPYKRAPAASVLVFARAPTSLARKSKQPYACALRVEIAVHPSVGHSAMRAPEHTEYAVRLICGACVWAIEPAGTPTLTTDAGTIDLELSAPAAREFRSTICPCSLYAARA